jgi:parallel beta-helix repeat protein
MKNSDRKLVAIVDKFYFSALKLMLKGKYISGLLIAVTVGISGNIRLQTQPTLAQETITLPHVQLSQINDQAIAQSISLDKLDKNIIYVNPKSGNDSQLGKKTSPLKTITQALKIATAGTKIQLATGTYNEATGETFPLVIEQEITLQGNAENQGHNVIIQGGDFSSPTGAGQNVAIVALKDAESIVGVSITNDHSRGHGLWIESSNPKVVGNTFTRNGNTGVSVNGKSSPLIEDNYFYNNSGNGLLVYGTSQPKVTKNTFEQTGFGVSLLENAAPTLNENYFDSNRIGVILEGNAQAVLRDNEIINSEESGLTAIAQSQVDLGTSDQPGNNVFRSNKQLDIQNITSNEIVAVGTETNGDTVGEIDFEQGEFVATANSDRSEDTSLRDSLPLLPPVDSSDQPSAQLNLPATIPPAITIPPTTTEETSSLPSPPPLPEAKTSNKELVFTASSSAVSSDPKPEPVPFPPEVNDSSLSSNSSSVGSAVAVKYKVLVEAEDEYAASEVRSLYPDAFATVYQDKSVLQIGAFNNWDKAEQAQDSLEDLGLDTHILE